MHIKDGHLVKAFFIADFLSFRVCFRNFIHPLKMLKNLNLLKVSHYFSSDPNHAAK